MNLDILERAFKVVRDEQAKDRYSETPEKNKAISEVLSLFSKPGYILDIGSCPYSKKILEDAGFAVSTWEYEDGDMHNLNFKDKFDFVLARHVLEHSPFPLYLLMLIHQVLKAGGDAIVVVPNPLGRWVMRHNGHVATLSQETWEKIFILAGFDIIWGSYGTWTKTGEIEFRYLLRKV